MGKIALNVMGGDYAPQAMIDGAKLAADEGHELILLGSADALSTVSGDFESVTTTEVIAYDVSDPANAFRASKDNPVRRAAELIREGRADAMVDCGNTAITLTAGTLVIGRIRKVKRAAIPVMLPRIMFKDGAPAIEHTLLLDAGANTEVDPSMLSQFAFMGSLYMELVGGVERPRVGTLSNGAEDEKGTQLVHDAMSAIRDIAKQAGINYVGNVEGKDLYNGNVDVVVTDGFTGNIVLKTSEGMATMMDGFILSAFQRDEETKQAYQTMKPHLQPMQTALDPTQTGGALLLGIKGVSIIGHGSSNPTAVLNAIRQARQAHDSDIIERFTEQLSTAA